ncbi:MAG: hypothetical protein II312_13805 [Lachnospiraceae bacterium]|nr:hypothetical protein [Lachnospiraceae bacterium]MEE0918459.1 hypothetical protein [Lachnospiraceae bacterium]
MTFRTYTGNRMETGDYQRLHNFLVETKSTEYTYARFDWMMTNWDYLEDRYLERIGIWESEGKIVGAMLFDHSMDVLFPMVLPGYESLYQKMYHYASEHMVKEDNPEFLIYAKDSNTKLQKVLRKNGMIATEEKDMVALFDLSEEIPKSNLTKGYRITSLEEHRDYEQYMKCMFKGFGHEEAGETFSFTQESLSDCKKAYERSNVDLYLKISVEDEAGNYVAHAGMWYDKKSEIALVEPVCTIPECRKMGFGKEAVFEGLRRVKKMGAKIAVVGSSQQFYYSIGFIPYSTGTVWKTAY